ncbi:MAG TPA: ABC transporter permease [Blastocatellia bacterium]|nr:ABC transporter permease [Blastocatellia bacterium]
MDAFIKDFRYGLRMLAKNPGFTAVAVIALSLGIGANAAIFSCIDGLLLNPFSFDEPERLVAVSETLPQDDFDISSVAPADFLDFRNENTSFEEIAATQYANSNLTGAGEPERIDALRVSPSFFRVFGVEAASGRTLLDEEEQPGRDQVVVLSHKLWQRRFASDPRTLGSTISLDGRPHTVVGIMPADFDYPKPTQLWLPLVITDEFKTQRAQQYLQVIARLKLGIAPSEAQAELNTTASRLEQQYPQTNTRRRAEVALLSDKIAGDFTPMFLWTLMGAVGFVLLLACVNVANMQLARASSRYKEMAIRSALGATRPRVMRLLLSESLLLALMSAVLGILLAMWFIDLIQASIPPDITRGITGWDRMTINTRVLGFTLSLAVLTGIVFGFAPALHVSKPDLNETLKEGSRGSTSGAGRHRLRSMLVISEVALALVLLVGAGLMVKGFSRMVEDQKKGFNSENLLTMRTSLTESKYPEMRQRATFYKQVIERIEALAEVKSASVASYLPTGGAWITTNFSIEGRAAPPPGHPLLSSYQVISPGYFQTMQIPLLRGRVFTDSDGMDAPRAAIISESMAARHWPGEDPLGKRIKTGPLESKEEWATIIGIVGNVKRFIFDREPQPTMYICYLQAPPRTLTIAARTEGDPMSAAAAVKSQILGVDPDQPVYEIATMEKDIADEVSGVRLSAGLMAILGVIALVLSAVGVYGVMAYSVSQRTHEIGIRMALGARHADVLRMVLWQAMKLAGVGLGLGLPLAFLLSSAMSSLLFGMVSLDFSTFALFTVVLASVALVSSYIPARNATRVDPMIALRVE